MAYNTNEPLVSIIIPVYNGENYVCEAINSGLSQSYKNIEVIVVNDGSTDHTEEIVLAFGDRIRYFKKENGGVATALNLGIKNMRGEYFSWLSHDDIYYWKKIENEVHLLVLNNARNSIVIGNFEFYDEESGDKTLFDMEKHCFDYNIDDGIYPALFGVVHACTMLVPVSCIKKAGLLNEKLITTQDTEWIFRLLRSERVLVSKEALMAVRLHREQGKRHIRTHTVERAETYISILDEITDSEVKAYFGSEYEFYYQMALFLKRDDNIAAYAAAKKKFEAAKPPADMKVQTDYLCRKLSSFAKGIQKKICLYGRGNYGKYLCSELLARDIEIDFFVDADPALWNECYDGVVCRSMDSVDLSNYIVIVTLEKPDKVCHWLREQGITNIATYDDVMPLIKNTLPKYLPN